MYRLNHRPEDSLVTYSEKQKYEDINVLILRGIIFAEVVPAFDPGIPRSIPQKSHGTFNKELFDEYGIERVLPIPNQAQLEICH
jgi:hypothetical protein